MDDVTATAGRTPWDVGAWALGPARPYRINTLYRLDAALVTVTGQVVSPDAAGALSNALQVFEPLTAPLFLDLCHATLDDLAARVVVEARERRERTTGMGLQIRHAEPATRQRLVRASTVVAGVQPVLPVVTAPWVG